jgi:ADP-heptose:LPS heptosyltransferase
VAVLGEHPAALAGKPIAWNALERVLLVRPDNLGDVLLLGPALRSLRAAAPTAYLDLLTSPAGAAVVPLLPEIGGTLVTSPSWQDAGPAPSPDPQGELALVRQIQAGRYDAALVLTSFSQSPYPAASLCLLAGVPVRAGLSAEFGGAVLTHWVPSPAGTQHQVDRVLYLLERIGVAPVQDRRLHAVVPVDSLIAATRVVGVADRSSFAVLLPGASCSSRRYPQERWAAVASGLIDEGLDVVVAGNAREEAMVLEISRRAGPSVRAVAGVLDVPQLAALLAGAAVAVTNNSGGMHLADAVRAPLVTLFAGTELVEEYAPRSTTATVLRRPTWCTPCRTFTCPYAQECLDVSPAEVVTAAIALARRPPAQRFLPQEFRREG